MEKTASLNLDRDIANNLRSTWAQKYRSAVDNIKNNAESDNNDSYRIRYKRYKPCVV